LAESIHREKEIGKTVVLGLGRSLQNLQLRGFGHLSIDGIERARAGDVGTQLGGEGIGLVLGEPTDGCTLHLYSSAFDHGSGHPARMQSRGWH